MSLKTEIKKAINQHSKKYTAKKVWNIEETENMNGDVTIWIEVSAKKRRRKIK